MLDLEWSAELDRTLTEVLVDFAHTMVTDFRLETILHNLVTRIVALLPVTAAGVTLISNATVPQRAAASDARALRYVQLQADLGEGPRLEVFERGTSMSIPDLDRSEQFPRFVREARAAGLAAVFTFPLNHGGTRLGVLDLYRDVPGPLSEQALAAAQTLADVVASYLINAEQRLEMEATHDRVQAASLHDSLTGLPNRALLLDRLRHALARTGRSGLTTALVYVDLDAFKSVNDTHGHAVGDALLAAVGQRLQAAVRPSDTAARLHGDEFAVLCEDLETADQGFQIAQRIHEAFRLPFRLPGLQILATASVGVAFGVAGSHDTDAMMHHADLAMFEAKRARSGPQRFTPDLQSSADDRASLVLDLRHAAVRGELEAVYQPIVDLISGRTTGFEALLRWMHPQRGLVGPTTLIPLAEESGLITDIGRWVLSRALTDQRSRNGHHQQPPTIAVNVSARQLLATDFVATIADALTAVPADTLHLEITESVLIADEERAGLLLSQLKDLGVTLSLDDFGTGYSSLVYLKRFPFDIIKIDRTFITDLGGDPASHTIVSSIIDLVHALGMTVIAEGVETVQQRDLLTALGCDAGQGYFFARPGPLRLAG